MKRVLSKLEKKMVVILLILLTGITPKGAKAQSPCNAAVPAFTINMTGKPDSVWSSPNIARNNTCCAATHPDECIYFNLTLDPNVAGIQIDMIGADPAGSLFYDIGCTGNYPGGTVKCITGVGPHQITFCKPGGNKNVYKITSVAKPIFPPDTSIRIGCKRKLITYGIVNSSVTWTAVNSSAGNSPAQLAFFNTFLDSLHVASPTYSAPASATNIPAWVEYSVCGYPQASSCGFSLTVCDVVRVWNIPKLNVTVTPTNPTFCGAGAVTLTANISGGLAPYSYSWTVNSMTTPVIGSSAVLTATTGNPYYVRVYDKLYSPANCPFASAQVQPTVGTPPTASICVSQKVCKSNPLATVSGTVLNPVSFTWTTSGDGTFSTPNFTTSNYTPGPNDLTSGVATLSLVITGGSGCGNLTKVTKIYYSPSPSVTISSGTLACFNSTTTLVANAIGGITSVPYKYLWSNTNTLTTNNTLNVGGGNYSVIVYDSLGCSASANVNVSAPTALNLLFAVINNTVNGGNNGSATVTPGGGTPGYSVVWNPGGYTTMAISSLTFGIYTATVTDANGCQVVSSTIVNEPRCLAFSSAVSATNATCYKAGNGVASVTVSGGTPAYSYTWNTVPAQFSSVATNLNAGVYSVLISDSNTPACFQTANVTVSEPSPISTTMTHTDVTTLLGNDGAAAVFASGGSPAYTYSWSTTATTSSITNLVAGNYSVTVTDSKGCSKPDYVLINQPPCNNLVVNVLVSNPLCNGGFGSAQAFVSGAVGSPTITWSNMASGISSGPLSPGSYTVTVDTKTCVEIQTFDVTQPFPLSLGLLPTNISCANLTDGSIDITVSGGTIPYTYTWSSGPNSEDLTGLSAGNYSVIVKDANGCTIVGSAVITKPSPLTYSATTVQSVTCVNGTNGSIALTVSGGVAPYTYSWSTSATTASISNLAGGGYTVVVKDANNCIGTPPYLIIGISSPDSVKVGTFSVACSVPGSSVTQVYANPIGGMGSYSVSYNGGPYIAASSSTMLTNGQTYTVTAKDLNGCVSPLSQTLAILNEVKISNIAYNKCYPVGTTTTQVVVTPTGGDNGPYQVSNDNGNTYLAAGNYTFNANVASSYSVVIKDTRGCVSAIQIISLPSVLDATAAVTSNYNGQNISCFGLTDGTASVTATGGTGVYTYTWNSTPTQSVAAAVNLGAGTYSVTVKDGNNCTITKTVTLVAPSAISATAGVSSNYNGQNISCFGLSDGSATVAASGATSPYTYQWNSIPTQTTTTASNLSAGVYSVIVKDVNNCAITKTVTLTQPTAITATTSITSNYNGQNISCFGLSDGSASVATSGGTGAYSFTWTTTPAQNTASASALAAGVYSVTVKDVNGCSIVKTVTLTQPTQIAASTSITSNYNGQNISCFGLSNGSASVTTSGGTGAYSYTWTTTPAQNTAGASALAAGAYSVTVKDANGCSVVKTVTLTQPTAVTSTAGVSSNYNGQNISCFGLTNGSATVAANGGTGSYSYTWTSAPTQSTSTASNLGAGTYSITVADINGCSITKTVTLVAPSAISATAGVSSNYNGQNISCFGLSDGSATVAASGATSPYTYQWNSIPTQTTTTASNLSAGVYSVIVKDVNNCAITKTVTLTQPTAITATTSITSNYNGQNISCFGLSDGSASVTTSGGTGAYSYTWTTTPAQNTASASALAAGAYSVTVKDVNGCSIVKTVTLTQPTQIAASTSITSNYNGQNISCFSLSNGSASVTTSGGTGAYSYTWTTTPAQNTASASALAAGVYSVTVKDVNGCAITKTVSLTQPSAVSATTGITSTITCFNYTNGVVSVTATGGTNGYTYTWSPTGGNNATASNLGFGTYTVTVADINACSITKTVTLINPTQVTATAIATSNFNGSNVSCFGNTDGTASVTANGGTGSYTYQWNTLPVQTTPTATNLTAGTHSVLVNDGNNCSVTATVNLTQPAASITATTSILSNYNGQNISCFNAADGSASVTTTGGTAPYSYTWTTTPAQNTASASALAAGVYSVTVKDVNGCSIVKTVTLTQPTQIAASTSITSNYNGQNISCFGLSNGSASVTTSGGTGAYSYTWTTTPAQNTASASALAAGVYSVTVKDVNGCAITKTVSLTQPSGVTSTAGVSSNYNGQNISCFGLTDGSATVAANGGTGSYSYTWTSAPTQSTSTASNLGAGTYSITVADINGCSVTSTVSLTQPSAISATAVVTSNYNGQNVSCFGYSDGSASVTASGATTPYTYQWNTIPSQTTASASNLSAGVYSVVVKDVNNCAITKTVTLTQPASLSSTVSVTSNYNGQNVTCFGATNGSAVVTVTNGTSPYTYTWSTTPAQTSTIATNLGAGNYSVVIVDVNGCTVTYTVTLTQPTQLVATTSITSNYNGQDISCFGLTDGSASVTASGATTPYTYSWTTAPTQTNAAATGLGAGNYSVVVTDINGCTALQTVTLTQPTPVNAVLTSTSNYNGYNVSCFSYTNGSIDISVSGGTGAFTYTWSNTANTQDVNNLGAGNYSVVATDVNGCKDTLNVTLTQPTKLIVTIDSLSHFNGYNVSCKGSTNGTIYVSTTGGVPNYSFSWSNSSTTQTLTNVGVGSYFLNVADLNNCNENVDTFLIEPPAITNTVSVSQPLCNSVSNGSVNLTVGGGVSPFTFNWSNSATTEDISNITAGTYSVVFTDANGCKDSTTATVTQPQNINLVKEVDKIKCYGDTTASVKVSINGGTTPYNYNWSNGSTAQNLSSVGSGTYIVTVTDANGCVLKDTTKITQPAKLELSIYSPTYPGGYNISTYNGNDGSIELTVNGGTSPYAYNWSNGATSQNVSNLIAPFPNPFPYFVIVTDSNGCKATAEIKLTQPLLLEMPTAYSPNGDGKNDYFVVHGIEAFPSNVITVFNRWGNVVYNKGEYKNEWDGHSNNGSELPDGTYFVILEINKGTKTEIILKGYVELRRY